MTANDIELYFILLAGLILIIFSTSIKGYRNDGTILFVKVLSLMAGFTLMILAIVTAKNIT